MCTQQPFYKSIQRVTNWKNCQLKQCIQLHANDKMGERLAQNFHFRLDLSHDYRFIVVASLSSLTLQNVEN